MPLPLRTRLFWALLGRLGAPSMLQMPPERIPEVRAARSRALRIPMSWLVIGRAPRAVELLDEKAAISETVRLHVRVYRPRNRPGHALPLIVNFHGGGWVGGDIRQSEWWCASMARAVPAVVVSVEYRLAPEHRFPIPAEDCYAATSWAQANARRWGADPERLAVMGDSAGGNLAAAVCLMARDRGRPRIGFQLLIYPAVELIKDFPSAVTNARAPILTKKDMDCAPWLYCRTEREMAEPYASPLRGDLAALPPALIQTAEFDPLRDQGPAYAAALHAAGVPAQHVDYAGAIHGYISLPGVSPRAGQALADAAAAVRQALATAPAQEFPALG